MAAGASQKKVKYFTFLFFINFYYFYDLYMIEIIIIYSQSIVHNIYIFCIVVVISFSAKIGI